MPRTHQVELLCRYYIITPTMAFSRNASIKKTGIFPRTMPPEGLRRGQYGRQRQENFRRQTVCPTGATAARLRRSCLSSIAHSAAEKRQQVPDRRTPAAIDSVPGSSQRAHVPRAHRFAGCGVAAVPRHKSARQIFAGLISFGRVERDRPAFRRWTTPGYDPGRWPPAEASFLSASRLVYLFCACGA